MRVGLLNATSGMIKKYIKRLSIAKQQPEEIKPPCLVSYIQPTTLHIIIASSSRPSS